MTLFHQGLAILPISRDRLPRVAKFSKWSRRPGVRTVAKWVEQYPSDNIAVVPGLSNVLVVDVDDASQTAQVEELLGATPLRVNTNRGQHLYYRKSTEPVPGNLRRFGLKVDLKRGNSLVIAPPSVHSSGKLYALDGCDWSALKDLPRPNTANLRRFIESGGRHGRTRHSGEMRDGSRKQWLNDLLVLDVYFCRTLEQLLEVARRANATLPAQDREPLDDAIVVARAAKVWNDRQAGRISSWQRSRGVARCHPGEIDLLGRLNAKRAADALMLLMRFRSAHSARCRRGETFSITPMAMARDQVLPGWTRQRYEKARDLLLEAHLIAKVSALIQTSEGRIGATYRLAEQQPL